MKADDSPKQNRRGPPSDNKRKGAKNEKNHVEKSKDTEWDGGPRLYEFAFTFRVRQCA